MIRPSVAWLLQLNRKEFFTKLSTTLHGAAESPDVYRKNEKKRMAKERKARQRGREQKR